MTYQIPAGKMYASGVHIHPILFPKELSFRFSFTESCLYDGSQFDQINKLAGISYGFHHNNSARVGWEVNSISLYLYCYAGGDRTTTLLGNANVGTEYLAHVSKSGVEVTGVGAAKLDITSSSFWGYRLYPYFGGTKPAPHDMTIQIGWL
jgi:hypothetical protein